MIVPGHDTIEACQAVCDSTPEPCVAVPCANCSTGTTPASIPAAIAGVTTCTGANGTKNCVQGGPGDACNYRSNAGQYPFAQVYLSEGWIQVTWNESMFDNISWRLVIAAPYDCSAARNLPFLSAYGTCEGAGASTCTIN